jgi:[protein-PII] uridylyltransferase
VADDRPGLLALIAAALAAARLGVVGAQVYSWCNEVGQARALDVFWVQDRVGPAGSEPSCERIERDLSRLIRGEVEPAELLAGLRRPSPLGERPLPTVCTHINIDNRAATDDTVLEITTQDRPGLLYGLASALQREGLTISLAKINTEGQRVADVFYVTDANGSKLMSPEQVERLKQRIVLTIEQLQRGVIQ